MNFKKSKKKTKQKKHFRCDFRNAPVWLGAHGTVFQKIFLFHVLSLKNNRL